MQVIEDEQNEVGDLDLLFEEDQKQEEVNDSTIDEERTEIDDLSSPEALGDQNMSAKGDELRAHSPLKIADADESVRSSISDLPITVSVHVGTFSMPLEQVENLRENDLIMVEPFYQNKVSLRVGGSEIGVGKIVSLNGDVAIQIIRLWS